MTHPTDQGLLHGIRVLDLATTRAELAGRVLADLGAEVIKLEPPTGCDSRHTPPFDERPGTGGASLYWAALGLNKHSAVLDVHTPAGLEQLKALVRTADILIESFDPGHAAANGFGYEALAAINPRLIYASITPFGQTGPDANSAATDLTLEAAGGLLGLQGDGDRPPVPVGYPQASFHAGAQAAADSILALWDREHSGRGQHLDVSMQSAMVWTLMNATGYPANTGGNPGGFCEARAVPAPSLLPGIQNPPRVLPCADGWFVATLTLGALGGRTLHNLLHWAEDEGQLEPGLCGRDWVNWIGDVVSGAVAPDVVQRALDAAYAFCRTLTKRQLQDRATRDAMLVAPVYDVSDLLTDPHLEDRQYWQQVEGITYAGPFARLGRNPITYRRSAPKLGQDQHLIENLPAPAPIAAPPERSRKAVFEGLKVLDLAWVGAGPLVTRGLGDHGATVLHIESSGRPDVLRTLPPFKDNVAGLDRAQFMANFNSSKYGVAINLATPKGKELILRMARWADVVVESFTPGSLKRLGLDYEVLSRENPAIVMLSSCLRGQTGPERTYGGFGGQGAALAGLHGLTGWPDRPPFGPWGAYTDFIAPRLSTAALVSALLEAKRTGKGMHIDFSQVEGAIHFLEPLVLDYTVNGRVAPAAGLSSATAAPHGVYRTQGTERYVAIACETEAQWQALLAAAPLQAFSGPQYASLAARQAASEKIDAALSAWCAPQEPFALAASLKAAGVPASVVLWPTDLYQDAQLAHRDFFPIMNHTVMGPTPYDGLTTIFSETPGWLRKAGPCLGEDTEMALTQILGLSDEELIELAAEEVLS